MEDAKGYNSPSTFTHSSNPPQKQFINEFIALPISIRASN